MTVSTSVDALLSTIQNSPGDIEFLKETLLPTLKATPDSVFAQESTSNGADPLDILMADCAKNTLPLAHFLPIRCFAKLSNQPKTPEQFQQLQKMYTLLTTFVQTCNPDHIRLAPAKITLIGNTICRFGYVLQRPIITIKPLIIATTRFSLSPNHLSSLHSITMKQCLLARVFKAPLSILENFITEIDSQTMDVKIQDFLTYMYYGGMIYTGLKDFVKAQEMFMLAISAPAQVCSQIQVESYKKYILVSLLVDGKVPQLPKQTSPAVGRVLKNACLCYLDLQSAYESHNSGRLQSAITKYTSQLQSDNNLGLAKQLISSLNEYKIINLTHTYLTLSVHDIATHAGLSSGSQSSPAISTDTVCQSTESLLLKIIAQNKISANISHEKDLMVQFFDDPEKYDDDEAKEKLNSSMKLLMELNDYVRNKDASVASSKEFLSKSLQGSHYDRSSAKELDEMDFMVDQ
ncbi:hypothetical protein BKA69DRAFT_1123850 [Paraphysoderma sedebokerense]|nr:hypothetical protein BKA69DRAFT_1123850 [Paraphysoderma sedebokerense]